MVRQPPSISTSAIDRLIQDTELKFKTCWATLRAMKEGRIGTEEVEDLLRFQPTLADALYEVEQRRQLIGKRQKYLVSRKQSYDSKWFATQMRSFGKCSDALTALADIGASIGDAFVWFFYHRSQHMLRHHLERPSSGRIPTGVGGRGELEFVRRIRLPDHFVIYHGITSFLKVGDVSFVDRRTLDVVAVGELKSHESAPGQLKISLHVLSVPGAESIPFVPEGADPAKASRSSGKELPPNGKRRLARQLKSMADAVKNSVPDSQSEIHNSYHFDDLKKITDGLLRRSHAYSQIGSGLLIIAVRPSYARSFSRRVMSEVAGEGVVQRLVGLSERVMALFDPNAKPDNCLILGRIKTTADADTVPLFWWSVDVDLAERVYFRDIEVLTAYNPAHLIARLRSLGFEVETIARQVGPDYRIALSPVRGGRIEIGGLWYFLRMIHNHLMKEEKVVEMLLSLVSSAENGTIPINSRVEISVVPRVV
jgi:hypothetical protein